MNYTIEDLRRYYKYLKEDVSAEEYKVYVPKENEEEIYIAIGTEEVVIMKQDNTVISSFGNYNSVHEIVEELLNR
jgi:hypothetical protein